MAQADPRGGDRSPVPPAGPRSPPPAERRATGADPDRPVPGGRSVRFSRGWVDPRPRGGRAQGRFWRPLPSGPCPSPPAGSGLAPPETAPARDPTGRGGQRAGVCRPVAGPTKGAAEEGRTIVGVDEAGFSRLPAVGRPDAPRGPTPVLRVRLTRAHVSVMSAITPAGRLLRLVQERAYRSEDVAGFLKHLLRPIPGQVTVIGDGAPIHGGPPSKDFRATGGAERLRLERLPGYAPDLNPDEGVWNTLKRGELRNVRCCDLHELRHALDLAIARLRHRRQVIRGCIKEAGYDV
jgi:transposase